MTPPPIFLLFPYPLKHCTILFFLRTLASFLFLVSIHPPQNWQTGFYVIMWKNNSQSAKNVIYLSKKSNITLASGPKGLKRFRIERFTVGSLIIRNGFWGISLQQDVVAKWGFRL